MLISSAVVLSFILVLVSTCWLSRCHDAVTRSLLLDRRPDDWTLSWGGSGQIWGWGHNHRGQLGGVDGAKVKVPVSCDALAALRPVQLIGGEQTLFAITADGKVSAPSHALPYTPSHPASHHLSHSSHTPSCSSCPSHAPSHPPTLARLTPLSHTPSHYIYTTEYSVSFICSNKKLAKETAKCANSKVG